MICRLLVVLSLLTQGYTVPVKDQVPEQTEAQCATECSIENKFQYAPGTTYQFNYKVMTTTTMAGASEDTAKTHVQARAEIEVLGYCDFGLRLLDVSLRHTDGKRQMKTSDSQKEFSQILEQSILRFSFNNGVISHICPMPGDPVWALNIRRGLLSAFQNGMTDWNVNENKTETDVAGECKTSYEVSSAGYYTSVLKKSKDIMTCTKRQQSQGHQYMVPYHVDSEIQSLPIMKTSHECELTVATKGLLKKSDCTETHIFRPFANGQSGGSTIVSQILTFTGERRGIRIQQTPVTVRSPLVFDYQAIEATYQGNAMVKVMATLGTLCQTTDTDIRPETPHMFSTLIEGLRYLDIPTLAKIDQRLKTSAMCPGNKRVRKFFIDALPFVKSSASVQMMTTLIINGEINAAESRAWLLSFALLKSPTTDMFKYVKMLIANEKTRPMAMLPVSSMLHNYCHNLKPGHSCDEENDIMEIIASMEKGVDSYCDTRREKMEKTLLTLRALGNVGHMTRSLGVITRCLKSRYSSVEVKVTAVEAFRRMPCDADDADLWSTLQNTKAESELRIHAYLALMRCPQDAVLTQIESILNKEGNVQVGAFMYSHLTNLMETSDPHKQGIARLIQRLNLEDKFEMDPMKHSRNMEMSTLLNKVNTGFTSDSNIIWPGKGWLPRSVSTNFTVALFGNSINLLDIGGRIEGLEAFVLNKYHGTKPNPREDIVRMSMYGRIFGNEMFYTHTQTAFDQAIPKMPSSMMDMLIKLSKNHNYEMTHSMQIMDSSMFFPTVGGLPIHLHLNGSTTLDLQVSGKVDLRKVAAKPRSLDIQGEVNPSAAVEITSTMGVHAFMTKTGLRMRNVMHTSTSLKGRILLDRGQQFHFEIDAPKEKMEIFEASSRFFLMHDGLEKEQQMIVNNRKELTGCTGNKMAKVVGMELCGLLSFPNASMQMDSPYFPLTGPSHVKLTMMKKDTHSSYKLFVKRVENKKNSVAQISFSTPGSKTSRTMLMDVTLNHPTQEIEVTIATPWKKAAMKSALINTKDTKSLVGKVIIDESMTYSMTSEVKVTETKTRMALTPMIVLRRPKTDDIQLTGVINLSKPMKSASADLALTGLQKIPVVFKGDIFNTRSKKGLSLTFSKDPKQFYAFQASNNLVTLGKRGVTLNSILELKTPKRQLFSAKGNLNYRTDKSLKMDIAAEVHRLLRRSMISASIIKNTKKNAVKYTTDLKLKSSRLTGRMQGMTTIKGKKLIASKMSLEYIVPRVTRNKITMNTKFNDRSTKAYSKYNIKSNLDVKKNPEYNMGLNIAFDYKKRLASADIDLKYGPNPKDATRRIHLNGLIKKKIKNVKNAQITYKMQAEAPRQNINWVMTGKHQHTPRMVDSVMKMNYDKGKQVNMDIKMRDQSSKLKKMNSRVTLGWPGREYVVITSVQQRNAKQYQHILNVKDNKGMKHNINTMMTLSKAKTHSVSSNINLHGMRPVVLSTSATLDPKNFLITGEAKRGKDVYGMTANGKYAPKSPRGKIDLQIYYPTNRMGVFLEGGAEHGKYDGKIETMWNGNKKNGDKASVEGYYIHKTGRDTTSFASMFHVKTPMSQMSDVGAMFKLGSDITKYDMSAKLTLGGKSKAVSTLMTVKKPISMYNFQANMLTKTPMKGYRVIELDVNHKINPSLAMVLKGVLENKKAEVAVSGQSNGDRYRRDLKGQLSLKSNIQNAEYVTFTFSHNDDTRKFKTSSTLEHNKDKYVYDMDMTHYRYGWQVENAGTIMISTPHMKLSNNWQHKNTDRNLKSSMLSKWNNKKLSVSLTGNHRTGSVQMTELSLDIQSPWPSIRDTNMVFNHQQRDGVLKSKSTWTEAGRKQAMYELNFKQGSSKAEVDFTLKPLYYREEIKSKANIHYERYPVTGMAELEWLPRRKAMLSGSAMMRAWNDADINVRFTSPLQDYENLVLKATSKEERQENIFNLNIDTGVRQNIDVEGRFRNDYQKLLRLKVMTPYRQFPSLNTGMIWIGEITDFDTRGDFELKPHIGKLTGHAMIKYDQEINANLQLESPFEGMRSLDFTVSSNSNGKMNTMNFDLKYPPEQSHTLVTSYRFKMPILFDAKLASSNRDINGIGLSLNHNYDNYDYMVNTEAVITYQPNKKVETSIYGKASPDISAGFPSELEFRTALKTPFKDLRNNEIFVRHKGGVWSADSHAEYRIASHNASLDATWSTGTLTNANLAFKSSIPGAQLWEASFRKKGHLSNMKGNAVLRMNDDKMTLNFLNKASKDTLKSEMTLNTPYTEELNANVDIQGTTDSFNVKVKSSYGRKNSIESIMTYDMNKNDINGNAMFKYRMGRKRETMRVIITKSGSLNNLQFGITGTRNRATVVFNGSLKRNWRTDMLLELKTPWSGYSDLSLKVNHEGNLRKFKTSSILKYMDDKTIDGTIDFSFGSGRQVEMSTEINSGIKGFESVLMKFTNSYDERTIDFEGNVELRTTVGRFGQGQITFSKKGDMDNFIIESRASKNGREKAKLMATNMKRYNNMKSELSLVSPFTEDLSINFENTGNTRNFATNMGFKYGDSNTMNGKLSMQQGQTTVKTSGEMSYTISPIGRKDMSFDVFIEGNGNDISIIANGKIDNDVYTMNSKLKNMEDISGAVAIKTPIDGYRDMGMSFKHSGVLERFNSEAKIKFSESEEYAGKVEFYKHLLRRIETTLEMKTPIQGYEFTKFEYRHESEVDGYSCFSTVEYGNAKKIVYDMSAKFNPKPEFKVSLETPFREYRNLLALVSYGMNDGIYDMTSNFNMGSGKVFTLTGNIQPKNNPTGYIAMTTPFEGFTDLSANFQHKGTNRKFETTAKVVYMDGKALDGKLNVYQYWPYRLDATGVMSTPFQGMETTKVSVKHNDNRRKMTSSFTAEYGRRQKMDGTVVLNYKPSYDLTIDLTTPFTDYRKIEGKGVLQMIRSPYEANYDFTINNYKKYTANSRMTFSSWENVDTSLSLKDPRFGQNEASYAHTLTDRTLQGSAMVKYGRDQMISIALTSVIKPIIEGTLIVRTPFSGYEEMQGNVMYKKDYQMYDATTKINLGGGQVYEMETGIDYSTEPMTLFSRVKTPLRELPKAEIKMTHEGKMDNFKSTFNAFTPVTDTVDASTHFKYNTIFDMTAAATLKSSMDSMDDIELKFMNSETPGEKKMTSVIQWTNDRVISYDILFKSQEGWYEDTYHTDIAMTTPFEAIQSWSMVLDQKIKQKSYDEKFIISLNGDLLIDMDTLVDIENDPKVEVIVRQPWPMQMIGTTTNKPDELQGQLYLNWDRDDPVSNINIQIGHQSKPETQGFNLDLVHPMRSIGLAHKVTRSFSTKLYEGKLFWDADDDSQLSYSLELKDTSQRRRQMYEGNLNVGLPGRALGMTGAYSLYGQSYTMDGSFSWDTRRDTSKKMGVKATLTGTTPRKGELLITLPSFDKELKIDGEMSLDNGRMVFDTKTDISYSQDTRKTLTLVSKLEDITDYYGMYNYSLAVGVTHPYTKTDIMVTSHLGRSPQKVTVAMDTRYLTARRQNKNMALFAEINQLKNKLHFKMSNPSHKMEVDGSVVSQTPYKLHVISKMDNVDMMQSDFTMDTEKKAILLDTQYPDNSRLSISAMYPNSTAIQIEAIRRSAAFKQKELLIGLRLNTSHLLHTGISWRPGAMAELRKFVLSSAEMKGEKGIETWRSMSNEVAEEMAAKYSAMINAFSEEMTPILRELQQELNEIFSELKTPVKKMDTFYYSDNKIWDTVGQTGKDRFLAFRNYVASILEGTQRIYTAWFTDALYLMEEWKDYSARSDLMGQLDQMEYSMREQLRIMLDQAKQVDFNIDEMARRMQERRDNMIDQFDIEYIREMSNRISQVRRMEMPSYLTDMRIPPAYMRRMAEMNEMLISRFGTQFDQPVIRYIHGGMNEVYQQVRWAYNYWQVEKNVPLHLKKAIDHLGDIVAVEMEEHIKPLKVMAQNPVTVWRPDNGHIQLCLPLPLPVHRLDQLPDWSPYAQKAKRFLDQMTPDTESLVAIYKNASTYFSPPVQVHVRVGTPEDLIQMRPQVRRVVPRINYESARRYSRRGRRYRNRRVRT